MSRESKKAVVAPMLTAITASMLVSCGAFGQNTQNCAETAVTATPAAPTGPYSASTSEGVYKNLVTTATRRPSTAGALRIGRDACTATLVDAQGVPIQLRGMSTHGLQWFPEILNDNAFKALANDWGSNVVRLAMYVGESGYATNPQLKQKVIDGINLAIANDMYVIVDWHVHAPGDPNADVYRNADPIGFFRDISQRFPNNKHIIYEVANEPSGNAPGVTNDAAGWAAVKSYAEPIIKMLRDTGNQNIVIVGTPNWSQRPDLAALNPINDANTMYTAHFYTGTHKASNDVSDRGNVMSNVRFALQKGVPVFATEWGVSEASGNNGPFLQEADTWLDFLNKHNISWVNWSLTNKNETSAAFAPYELGKSDATSLDPGSDRLWSTKELTISGEYIRSRIKGTAYRPIDRTAFSETVWNFSDNTTQGFVLNADSPVKSVTVSADQGALRLQGMTASTDVSEGNYWANARISANGSTARPDLAGAKTLSMDVLVSAPTTVSIAAIPQSAKHGWANPTRAIQVTPAQFTQQPNGLYKATLTIGTADSPNFAAIAAETTAQGSVLTNLVLFVGAQNASSVWIDNITFSGNRTTVTPTVEHAPAGTTTIPSTFEDGTRQGWSWATESAVKTALTVETANGSKALSWNVMYPDVKPTDGWATAPRLVLDIPNRPRGTDNFLLFDLYLKPDSGRGTQGALAVHLAFGPPSLGYWAQAKAPVNVSLAGLASTTKTPDGLYRVQVKYDLNNFDKTLAADTALGKINIIVADDQSNFAGRMYVDNVRFASTAP